MIKARSIAFLLIFLMIAISSCRKEPGHDVTPTGTGSNYLSLKVDGVTKVASSNFATIYQSGNTLQIIAQLPGTEGISLMVNNVAIGTFDVVTNGSVLTYNTDSTYANSYLGLTGTIIITSLTNDTVVGTFQFVGTGTTSNATKVISDGIFKCKYGKI